MSVPTVRFGDFELDAASYELRREGSLVKLERLPMELLLLLVDRAGRLVTREEILDRLWGKNVFLDVDNSINTAVSKVRVALGDNPDDPAFIKTVPGKGYRFIAPVNANAVNPAVSPPAAARDRWLRPSGIAVMFAAALAVWIARDWRGVGRSDVSTIRSLAVLPLENLTGDPAQEFFADGMTDALITNLAQIGTLRVISRTSVTRYKDARKPLPEIARELGVDGIVEGTVTRSAGRVRITSQLIYAPRDQHLWARSYERDLGDVVSLQAEIAEAIAGEVRALVTRERRDRLPGRTAVDPEAYEAYLRGRYYWNQRAPAAVKKSIEWFQRAVEKDPNFALAYAGMADAYNFGNVLGVLSPRESSPEAKAAATKALVLDPRLAEAHAALGLVLSHYEFDFDGAQREFLKAIELNPNYANARLFYAGAYLTPMGRHADAIIQMKKALELDPLSVPLNNMMAETYLWAGDAEKSLQQFQRTIDLDPAFSLAHFFLAELLADIGRFDDAIGERERGELLLGATAADAASRATEFRRALRSRGPRGYWQRNLEQVLQARDRSGTRYVEATVVAAAYARSGDRKNAVKWLEKSYSDREGQSITLIRWQPDFRNLQGDPAFEGLLDRMGLPGSDVSTERN